MESALDSGMEGNMLERLLKSKHLETYQQKTISDLKGEFGRLARSRPLNALEYIEAVSSTSSC